MDKYQLAEACSDSKKQFMPWPKIQPVKHKPIPICTLTLITKIVPILKPDPIYGYMIISLYAL